MVILSYSCVSFCVRECVRSCVLEWSKEKHTPRSRRRRRGGCRLHFEEIPTRLFPIYYSFFSSVVFSPPHHSFLAFFVHDSPFEILNPAVWRSWYLLHQFLLITSKDMAAYDDFDDFGGEEALPEPTEKDYTLCFVRRCENGVQQVLLGMKKRGFGAGATLLP